LADDLPSLSASQTTSNSGPASRAQAVIAGLLSEPLAPGLYLVATPIGNLRDMTLRAIDTLAAADMVACEDTRVSGKLFNALGFKQKLIPYHDHNADAQRPFILSQIAEGKSIALISDAGMPLISDPGYKLVRLFGCGCVCHQSARCEFTVNGITIVGIAQ
jgi:16S rRNA (cytidine1402-2'-O)-methyltransferase